MTNIIEPNYTTIPNVIFDHWMPILSPAEFKVLISLYYKTFGLKNGREERTASSIAINTGLSNRGVQNSIETLKNIGLVKQENLFVADYFIKQLLAKKKKQYVLPLANIDSKICSWCGSTSYILHDHHYPISFHDGGIDVVPVCPSCHYEFHFLKETRVIVLQLNSEGVLA